ncbi:MAG: spore coat protein [Thermaerobacter sp.]|nr:spore coat protein [Thermaerobacter sp.]
MIGTKLSVSEAMGLHEILLVSATMVDKLAYYVDETEDRELESIFSAHLRAFERTYSELLGFAHDGGNHAGGIGATNVGRGAVGGGQKPNRQTVRPQPSGRINDRTMVMDCLMGCKALAVSATTAATEASQTTLRRTLADVSRHQLEMAYELYKIAEQHGWYPSLKPQDSPEEWLRSTHLPVTVTGGNVETSQIGAAYGATGYAHAAVESHGAFSGNRYAQAPRNYGTAGATRTAGGANWGAAGRNFGTAPEGTPPFQYGEPESTQIPHRR